MSPPETGMHGDSLSYMLGFPTSNELRLSFQESSRTLQKQHSSLEWTGREKSGEAIDCQGKQ